MSLRSFVPKWDIHGEGPSLEDVMPGIGDEVEGDPHVIAGQYNTILQAIKDRILLLSWS